MRLLAEVKKQTSVKLYAPGVGGKNFSFENYSISEKKAEAVF